MAGVSSTVTALASTVEMGKVLVGQREMGESLLKKKRQKKKNFKKKSLLHRLCRCCAVQDFEPREGRNDVTYSIEDGGVRVILSCCSNTWSTSTRDLDVRVNKNCGRFVQ